MTISVNNAILENVSVENVFFEKNRLHVQLSDQREIVVPLETIDWLKWLKDATPEERSHWEIEPGGFAIYWPDLDDGVEIQHLLSLRSLV